MQRYSIVIMTIITLMSSLRIVTEEVLAIPTNNAHGRHPCGGQCNSKGHVINLPQYICDKAFLGCDKTRNLITIFADHCSVEQMFVLRVVGTMAMVGIHAVGSVILKVMY